MAVSAAFKPFNVWSDLRTQANGNFTPSGTSSEAHAGNSVIFSIDEGAVWIRSGTGGGGDGTLRNVRTAWIGDLESINFQDCTVSSAISPLTLPPSMTNAQQAFSISGLAGSISLAGMTVLKNAYYMFSQTQITSLDFGNATALTNIQGICEQVGTLTSVSNVGALTALTNAHGAFSGCALPSAQVDGILNGLLAAGRTGLTLGVNGGTNEAPTPSVRAAFVNAGNTVISN